MSNRDAIVWPEPNTPELRASLDGLLCQAADHPLSRIAAVALHFNCANYPKPFPTAGGVLYAQLTAPGQWDTHVIQGLPGGPDATDAVPHEIEKDGRTYRATGSYYIHPWYPFYERVDSGVTDDQA